ncbi:hypothetical protein M413DRAFT_442284 [Hebeloma cylindrosporum]|uniref:F-box domain-containing protein n=1 Tax=Hebeloma cylindrosporum TaxID=76867 RepID=A0A0C2YXF7_HEBCY|nr:hypothetical protein M413DRAFT_442284 [Hebeloma cylindrosporum h7]
MFFWLQVKVLTMKLSFASAKFLVRRSIAERKHRLQKKLMKLERKARSSKKKAARTAKDLIIPSLPLVSKLELPEAPVPHLLRSNTPPTEQEEALVRAAIADAEVECRRLEEKLIERLAAGTASRGWETVTRHKIGRADRFIHQHQSVLSPLRRLPMEILQTIFMEVDPTMRVHTRWRQTSDIPWKLGQVCRIWRESALSLSLLWKYLPLVQLKKSTSHTRIQLACLSELIRRSGAAPLDIYIIAPNYDRSTHPVIDLLSKHSERWHTVSIESTPTTILGFAAIKGRLPSLKVLTLHTRHHTAMPAIEMFEVAPQLQAVYVSGSIPGDLKLPFSQLRHYKERFIWPQRIHAVVASPMLRTLSILELTDDVTFPVVTMPCLLKLHVKFQYRAETDCFANLTIPAIEEIKAVSYRGNLIPSLTSLLSRCEPHCPLKHLSIRTDVGERGVLTPLLELTPCLVSLDTSMPASRLDIRNLAGIERHKPLAPLLETCKFFCDTVVAGEMSLDLINLAFARCDIAEEYAAADMTLLHSGEVRRLTTLCLYFDGSPWTYAQQAELDDWPMVDTDVSGELRELKEELHNELPELSLRRRSRRFDRKWDERVDRILNRIENLGVGDPVDVYISSLHLSLKRLSGVNPGSELARKGFRQRAIDILEKWAPLFLEDLPRRRWAFQGPYSLLYISSHDALRTSPEALSIIYGLADEASFPAIFWPVFMA